MSNEIIYRKNTITNKDIVQGNCLLSHAMAGEELAVDTINFRVWSDTGLGKVDGDFFEKNGKTIITKDGLVFRSLIDEDYTKFIPRSTLEYRWNGRLINKFYLRSVERVGKYLYDFYGESAIGILNDTMHYGGVYTGETVAEVAEEILEGIPHEIDPIAGEIKLYGWLPIATKRDNLQQITIATAMAVRTKLDGSLFLTALTSDISGTFGSDRVAIGGNVSVDTPYTAVQISEHYYQAIEDEVTLFSETSTKTEFLKFTEPMHDLSITNGIIKESGANYAIIECRGFTELVGKKYLHTTRSVTVGDVQNIITDKIYSITDATLITALNSSAVARKLYDVCTKQKTIQANTFFDNEKSGDVVSAVNPYSAEMESAFLKRQDINISAKLLANSDFLVGYIPSGIITGYTQRILITSNTNFVVPPGITEIRIVLIGAGQGGQAGGNGTAGGQGKTSAGESSVVRGDKGTPGAGGEAGMPGKINIITIQVTPGTSIAVRPGTKGTGGAANGALGTAGTDTTFGAYSSADGAFIDTGYVDVLSGNKYGIIGAPGVDGKKSATAWEGVIYFNGTYYLSGENGSSQNYWLPGAEDAVVGQGGGGGGPAVGDNGAMGLDGSATYNQGNGFATGGAGGKGADATIAGENATIPGSGGNGGHGGGAGGGGGGARHPTNPSQYAWPGSGGLGGLGSKGGDGAPGCVIIYY